jgi:hypothetical protein
MCQFAGRQHHTADGCHDTAGFDGLTWRPPKALTSSAFFSSDGGELQAINFFMASGY